MRRSWDNETEIAAISAEARRRGTSYGKLIPHLTDADIDKLVREYRPVVKRKKRPPVASRAYGAGPDRKPGTGRPHTYRVYDPKAGKLLATGKSDYCAFCLNMTVNRFRNVVWEARHGLNGKYRVEIVDED